VRKLLNYVYVIAKVDKPLINTKKFGIIRPFLDEDKAVSLKTKPFTIQFSYETGHHIKDITVGVDAGYQNSGYLL